jgi:hypothetical protein
MIMNIPEGWTKEEWKAKLDHLLDVAMWTEESVIDEEDAEGAEW